MTTKKITLTKKPVLWQAVLLVVWAVMCYVFFQTQYHYHFFYQEQNQLFLMSSDYLMTYFTKPAWLACMAGDFFTQFYYYLYAGPAILTLSLMVLGDLMFRGMKRAVMWGSGEGDGKRMVIEWIIFAVVLLLMTVEAYMSLSESYKLSNIIALAGGAGAWWIAEKMMRDAHHIYNIVVMVVAAMVTYWMFGCGVWWMIVMILIKVMSSGSDIKMGLAFLVLPSLATIIMINGLTVVYYLNYHDASLYPGMAKKPVSPDQVEQKLAYDNEYYLGNYDKVISMYEADAEKTDDKSFFYCLALEQKGMLVSKLPGIHNPCLGTFLKIDDESPLFTIKMINEMYYLLGDMTYTERAALLANTFSPNGRNARMIKRLAEANLVTGDYPAAMKYLRLLSKTIAYKEWADHMIRFTRDSKAVSPATADILRKRQFVNDTDNIRLGDDCYVILTQLLDSNPENTAALDYLLCSDMLSKQRDVFIRDYEKYGAHARPFFKDIYESAKAE